MGAFPLQSSSPPRVAGEVTAGIVAKCLTARPKTLALAASVCSALVEAEAGDVVMVCAREMVICMKFDCQTRCKMVTLRIMTAAA